MRAKRVLSPSTPTTGRAIGLNRLLAGALLASAAALSGPALAANPDDIARTQEALRDLRANIQDIREQLDRDRRKQSSLQNELEGVEQRASRLFEALRTVRADIRQQQAKSDQTRRSLKSMETRLAHQMKALHQQLRAAYMVGDHPQWRLLLNQDDPATVARAGAYFERFTRARTDRIGEFKATIAELMLLRTRLEQELSTLRTLEQTRADTLAGVEQTRMQRESALQRIEQAARDKQTRLKELQADEQRMQRLLGALESALAAFAPGTHRDFRAQKGAMPWPVRGRLLARYHASKADGVGRWNGIWIEAGAGEDVRAVADGRVAYVGWMHRYGLLMVIDHGDGYFSLYGHNQTVNKRVGDVVLADDIISSAGDTGGHDRYGVYLEIRKGRDPLNPLAWLASN